MFAIVAILTIYICNRGNIDKVNEIKKNNETTELKLCHNLATCTASGHSQIVYFRVPALLATNKFRTPEAFFQDRVVTSSMFKYRDKQQLLTIYIQYDSSVLMGLYVHHCHMLQKNSKELYYMEQRCEDGVRIYSGICVRIIVSTTASMPSKFQDFPGPCT